jgi:hypothetical protein
MDACAWCDEPAIDWLCPICEQAPWPRGARYITRRIHFAGGNEPGYRLVVLDRAHGHRLVRDLGNVSPLEYCRDRNREQRP